jgi:hypothetical protein
VVRALCQPINRCKSVTASGRWRRQVGANVGLGCRRYYTNITALRPRLTTVYLTETTVSCNRLSASDCVRRS